MDQRRTGVKRGDLITAALNGDDGKPCPAVIIQSDHLGGTDSVLLCLVTSSTKEAPLHRLSLTEDPATGLRRQSQVMVKKIVTARKERCGPPIGRLDRATMRELSRLLMFVIGVTD
jgi:mRNA interferase MazF